ncbi:MAG TPA: AAA family ATPase [Stellaceae bacterium]|jgi:predicted ATPase|nr:AAA family ATPase [Stellaceae bacterium]
MALMLRDVRIAGYRSLRSIRFPVGRLSVFVGANGVGKTNLYRALELLQASAAGTLAHALAAEGGMESALWAGERRRHEPARIVLHGGFALSPVGAHDYSYEVAAGVVPSHEVGGGLRLPIASAAFALEPQIKEETLLHHHRGRAHKLLERSGPAVTARDTAGARSAIATELLASETALGAIGDGVYDPAIAMLRNTMIDWRFYHDLRTDRAAPLRQPSLAVTSPTLSSDGGNLAAVFATLSYIREDTVDLDRTIDDAFPGASLVVPPPGRFASFGMRFPDQPKRLFEAAELSDGTLRYLGLAGALLAYRLPAFIALNEPEASLHPDLLEPLARLIVRASERTQIWLVTHSERLANAIARDGAIAKLTVVKRGGATWIDGLNLAGSFLEEEDQ